MQYKLLYIYAKFIIFYFSDCAECFLLDRSEESGFIDASDTLQRAERDFVDVRRLL